MDQKNNIVLIAQKKIFFDQIDNKELFLDPNTKKPNFFRDMQKIKEHLKKEKNSDNEKKTVLKKRKIMKILAKKILLFQKVRKIK